VRFLCHGGDKEGTEHGNIWILGVEDMTVMEDSVKEVDGATAVGEESDVLHVYVRQ
jgi:hypothetical protein